MDQVDFLELYAGAAPAKGVTTWLVDVLRAAIAGGSLPAGARLPATRVLAAELGLSRGVVVEAYQRLTDEGLLSGRTGAGTVVIAPAGMPRGESRPRDASGMWLPLPPSADIELDLSPGVPDLSAFPRAAWLRAERIVLAGASNADLGYGDPRGSPRLRGELASWLARTRGVRAAADDLIVTGGVAQALALLSQSLRSRGGRRGRGRGPRVARHPRGARALGAADRADPGRRPGHPRGRTRRGRPGERPAHPGAPVPDRCGAEPGPPPRAAGPARPARRVRPDHRGRLRRRAPLRPRPGGRATGLGARAGRVRRAASPSPSHRACAWAG
nr:hypothetical protein GCM10020092_049770 [Actinoplanes digitatis]